MNQLFRDLRFGLRLLLRSPIFTATSVLLLAIGISANTLIFSAVNALLLRKLPVDQPEELVRLVLVRSTGFVSWHFPYELCESLAAGGAGLSHVYCQGEADVALRYGQGSERVRVHLVSPNFFSGLGVEAQLGRVLASGDGTAEAMPAVLSDSFWQRRFGRDPAAVGQYLTLNGRAFMVSGVTPRGFNGLMLEASPDVWVPAAASRWLAMKLDDGDEAEFFPIVTQLFGRLRAGVSQKQAEAETVAALQSAFERQPESVRRFMGEPPNRMERITHGVSTIREQFRRGLAALMVGVGLLLIMACANVAGLLMARAAVRTPEMSIRLALGASRWRLTRQLLSEGLPLALLGGGAGIVLTYACLPLLTSALPPVRDRAAVLQPLALEIGVDLRVLTFALAATLLSTLLFGLSPALAGARTPIASVVRAARIATRRRFLHRTIVVVQVAICTILLAGAALLVRTLGQMRSMDAGFDSDHIVSFTLDPRMTAYTAEEARALSESLLTETRALPSVSGAGIANRALMRGTGMKGTFARAGRAIRREDFLNSSTNGVTPGYFETMGMRLTAGRDFNPTDRTTREPQSAIVNQAFVRRFFSNQDPIGAQIGVGAPDTVADPGMKIVGVVSDARYRSLREEVHPTVYTHLADGLRYGFTMHVRTHGRPEAVIGPVRSILQSLDPELPLIEVHTLRQEVEASLWQERLLAGLSSVFGTLAMLLAGIGLFGALDFAVEARTREIGVRTALGAAPSNIVRLLGGEILALVATGIVAGLGAHAVAARWIRDMLYEVQPTNPYALGAAVALTAVAAILASLPPTMRAVGIDSAAALRHE